MLNNSRHAHVLAGAGGGCCCTKRVTVPPHRRYWRGAAEPQSRRVFCIKSGIHAELLQTHIHTESAMSSHILMSVSEGECWNDWLAQSVQMRAESSRTIGGNGNLGEMVGLVPSLATQLHVHNGGPASMFGRLRVPLYLWSVRGDEVGCDLTRCSHTTAHGSRLVLHNDKSYAHGVINNKERYRVACSLACWPRARFCYCAGTVHVLIRGMREQRHTVGMYSESVRKIDRD